MRKSKPQELPRAALWYKDAIIYEVHVKCFYDSNEDGIGDFKGLIQKLDYLQDLGVTCIWLLPFYPSPLRDDGYDISNYRDIHPSFGTLKDFRHFIKEAHRRNLRVITELVINHTSDQHPWFQEARKAPPGSAKRNYYVWSDTDQKYKGARIIFKDTEKSNWSWDPVANAYYWHRFFAHQPDLNFDNPHVLRAVIRVMRFWLDMGVDGLRLDAVPYLVEREGTSCENLPETHAILKEMRKAMDAHYKDRVFIAEANQWPSDVLPYFGKGDECHMAFHFPLMPRIFMALRQEDRHPITEILRQTPDIPPNCQWAIFLRNHDELTLEMVTDQERDYMYSQYATDPLMRLNLGIRRRLAPLVDNSRRRLELLFSLLFSFPGTPVVYYGDEIGMGDNYYLGDRNGVRTPMQWSSDRNGGFSRADFAKLYAPPLMDAGYGFQSTNVEAQLRDPSSLLNWIKRMIAISKRFKTFGRGTLDFLHPTNRKILAYVRRYGDETFLAVANLSRFSQPAELDLSEFEGRMPVEMLGTVEFPKIGKLPYFITLSPHGFYWFQLKRVTVPVTATESKSPAATQKIQEDGVTIALSKSTQTALFEKPTRADLEKDALPVFLSRQSWYANKPEAIKSARFLDWARLDSVDDSRFIALVEAQSMSGKTFLYHVPLAIAWGPKGEALRVKQPTAILAPIHGAKGDGVLFDATLDDTFCREWLRLAESATPVALKQGTLQGQRFQAYSKELVADAMQADVFQISGQHNHTTVRMGERLVLKLYRNLDGAPNPDVEMTRYLTEKSSFDRVPKVLASLDYRPKGGDSIRLGVVQEWVENQGDGWAYTRDEVGRYFDRVLGRISSVQPVDFKQGLPLAGGAPFPALAQDLIGAYLQSSSILGRRTAEMHRALASASADEKDFAPKPLTKEFLTGESATLSKTAKEVLSILQKKEQDLPAAAKSQVTQVVEMMEKLTDSKPMVSRTVAKGLIRVHGDYRLEQVLWTNNDFVLLDFEGEAGRSVKQRRALQSPLKDVAGMLRSFHYAAYSGLFRATADRPADFEKLEPAVSFWTAWAVTEFLKSYRETIAGAGCVPNDEKDFQTLLNIYLLKKTFEEIRYEIQHRPNWVGIPLEGLLSLFADAVPIGK